MTFPFAAVDGSFPDSGARTLTTATIANGASLSGAIDFGSSTLFAIQMPAAWTTANLTFQVSADGTTYANLYDSNGSEVVVTALVSQHVVIAVPAQWLGVRYLKIRSGTSGTPVNQGGDRVLQIVAVS